MNGPRIYYFAKTQLEYYANTTEPKLFPHIFEEMVKKSHFDAMENEKKSYFHRYQVKETKIIKLEQELLILKEANKKRNDSTGIDVTPQVWTENCTGEVGDEQQFNS